jgi:serine/threonine-protein kinase
VKVLDFGISKVRAASVRLSRGGEICGTPQFMAPEQALGNPDWIDARTDQFALGAIAFEMLTGHSAFAGDDAAAVLYRVVHEHPDPLARFAHWNTGPLQAVLDRALAKERPERYESMVEFARAFREAAEATIEAEEAPPRMTLPRMSVPREETLLLPQALVPVTALALTPAAGAPPASTALVPPQAQVSLARVPTIEAIPDDPPPPKHRNRPSPPPVEIEATWEVTKSVERAKTGGARAAALGVVALALVGLLFGKGWHRELRADLRFLRDNGLAAVRPPVPLPQPSAPEPATATAPNTATATSEPGAAAPTETATATASATAAPIEAPGPSLGAAPAGAGAPTVDPKH